MLKHAQNKSLSTSTARIDLFRDVDPPALSHCIANGINATIDPPTPCAPRLLGATEWRLEPTGGLRQSP
jgi:hypothetical protein